MTGNRIVYYILATFIAGCLLLIYIQYNSAKNVNTLIKGNEKLVAEFRVSNQLKELEKDVILIESKIRGAVSSKDSTYITGLEKEIGEVEVDLDQLQKITDDDSSVKYIDKLDELVHKKLLFSKQVLDSFHVTGKYTSEKLVANHEGKRLTDSIILVTQMIDSTRNNLLAGVTISIDESGKKAQQFGTILIVIVLFSGAVLFWYIINIIRQQGLLIGQLDVSEKRVTEAAEVKEKFMANMSHEIRTPLNAIIGFTNLLRLKALDDESTEFVQTIRSSGENLLAVINDILDLSKIEAGMMRIESAPFSIRSVIHSIQTMFKLRAADNHLQLIFNIDDSVPGILEGDTNRLSQILINLVGNSLKFTTRGTVAVAVTTEGSENGIVNIGIKVSDTGIGIEQDQLKNIFDRFQQAEDADTRKYGGTGLGLSIVKQLVELLNGSINVESVPGKGTEFKLVIPYKLPATDTRITLPGIYSNFTSPDFNNARILVVEDNEINQSLIKHLLKNWSLNFDMANNGREAIDRLNADSYNLILLDIQTPEMDGYTAAQTIRGKLKLDIPIIAMTAHVLEGERQKCISYGMNDYISKPIREDELHKLINKYTGSNVKLSTPLVNEEYDSPFKVINLSYMKQVSLGNIEYEKTVTVQFIEAIPVDLLLLEKALHDHDINELRQLAHNLRTTVSVMGLNDLLQPYLDVIEYEEPGYDILKENLTGINDVCDKALQEAKSLLETL